MLLTYIKDVDDNGYVLVVADDVYIVGVGVFVSSAATIATSGVGVRCSSFLAVLFVCCSML